MATVTAPTFDWNSLGTSIGNIVIDAARNKLGLVDTERASDDKNIPDVVDVSHGQTARAATTAAAPTTTIPWTGIGLGAAGLLALYLVFRGNGGD